MGFGRCISNFRDKTNKIIYSNLECSLFQEEGSQFIYEGFVDKYNETTKATSKAKIKIMVKNPSHVQGRGREMNLNIDGVDWIISYGESHPSGATYDFRLTPNRMEIKINIKRDHPSTPQSSTLEAGGHIYVDADYAPAPAGQGIRVIGVKVPSAPKKR